MLIVEVIKPELQWGRTFSSAEISNYSDIMDEKQTLQWGRTFSSAEISPSKLKMPAP